MTFDSSVIVNSVNTLPTDELTELKTPEETIDDIIMATETGDEAGTNSVDDNTNLAFGGITTIRGNESEVDQTGVIAGAQLSGTYVTSKYNNKKYKLVFLPRDNERCDQICGKLVGQGTTFCTDFNCAVNHRSGGRLNLIAGDIYVSAGTANRAFCEPTVSSKLLDQDVLEAWSKDAQDLTSWSSQFRAIEHSLSGEDRKLGAEELKQDVEAAARAES